MDFNAVTPGIIIVVYVVVELLKYFWLKTNEQRKFLPLCCIVIGAFIAVLLYAFYPEGIGVYNYVDAIATGGLSGIAATGCNQLYKQFARYSGQIEGDGNRVENDSITVNVNIAGATSGEEKNEESEVSVTKTATVNTVVSESKYTKGLRIAIDGDDDETGEVTESQPTTNIAAPSTEETVG